MQKEFDIYITGRFFLSQNELFYIAKLSEGISIFNFATTFSITYPHSQQTQPTELIFPFVPYELFIWSPQV